MSTKLILSGRRLRALAVIVAVAVAFAAGGLVASRFMVTPAQRAASAQAPPASTITVAVTKREISDQVVTRGNVVVEAAVDVLQGRAFPADVSVITAAPMGLGEEATAGAVLLEINGRPILALPGQLPAYEDLAEGSQGPLVKQLQEGLKSMGADIADPVGTFGESTSAAVEALYVKAGYAPQRTLPRAEVAFLPTLPARIVSSSAGVGSIATTSSLTLAAGKPIVTIEQADDQILALAEGTPAASLANELTGEEREGILQLLMANSADPAQDAETAQPAPQEASASVGVAEADIPLAWIGHNVRVTVKSNATDGEVLTVPSSAISTDGQGRSVITIVEGEALNTVPVETGVNGEGFTEIRGEVAEGDRVLVGSER